MIKCYLFDKCPGAHLSWTLAVFAVSKQDAKNYINVFHPRAHYNGLAAPGKIIADCGATTEKARLFDKESL